jgi:hypothetical protein
LLFAVLCVHLRFFALKILSFHPRIGGHFTQGGAPQLEHLFLAVAYLRLSADIRVHLR